VEYAHRLGITDSVTFHGHIGDDAKHAVLQQGWVHILPSRKEGWGLAVIEAAQHGVPTIGYRCSGGLTDSVVDGVTGLLVDDRDGLIDSLERLLGDHVLRAELGEKAAARSEEFSWARSAEAMQKVLQSVHRGEPVSGVL
jgi:glycosyltransferase involved in cell wall biosynthesis